MKHTKLIGIIALLLFITQFAKADTSSVAETNIDGAPNIYIDCSSCDNDFIRREITFVNFVRDRNQADIHLLVSGQQNGGGGREYMVEFIGQHDFDNMTDTLIFNTKETDTDDAIRNEITKYFKLGLIRFVANTPLSKDLEISYTKPENQKDVVDKWNNWVFELSGHMSINGEESYRSLNTNYDFETRRVTEGFKTEFGIWRNSYSQKFTDDSGSTTYSRHSEGIYGDIVFSLNNNWSAAYEYNFFASTYANKDFDFSNEIGLEYNIYPYTESSRRAWIIRLNLGATYMDYTERSIYNKTNEWLTYSRLRSAIELTQPWGSVYGSLNGILYLHDFEKNRLTFSAGMEVNIFEGFSVNFDGNYSRTRDQISLSAEGGTEAQMLLRQRELPSGYNYWLSFGMSYSFGSIYNNIVNPRF